ncbi:MAG: hypothetical protein A2086_05460 [Spirochaetes bacterium GWD1_27_9]|nr:MAG: hypothetical protein A2Z98_15915 [Spirochaetes bacterium GWB1_27_13]OHD26141.1 MAG: hypothetical protein A2Y34_07205 [Spirochaetes bacterium GWC1_27_15]OHD31825.1 MAG: hypothetical protein A2086_05460 [Spirochaetes bacterium GWD1_27_9]
MKKIFFCLVLIVFVFKISAADNTSDNTTDTASSKINDTLQYGIESEIVDLLKDIGQSPNEYIYQKLFERYNDALLLDTKIALTDFFSNSKNLPQFVSDRLFSDASSDLLDRRLETSLLNFLGKTGGIKEGNFLLSKLDSSDNIIKNITADAIGKMKVPELGQLLLQRLDDADKIEEKFLGPDIKAKLIIFFGENKSLEAVPYLKKIITDKTSDKYLVMFGMVSLLKIGDVSSIDIISENLKNEDPKIQEYAAYAISSFKNKEALLPLKKMLLHNNESVRYYACKGIVLNEDYDSISNLFYKFKQDPSKKVQEEALSSLILFDEKGIERIKDFMKGKKYNYTHIGIISAAVAKKPTVYCVAYLIGIYQSTDKSGKDIIARNVVSAKDNKIDPIIKELLGSEDYLIRIGALKAVYQIENSTLWETVEAISKNDPINAVKLNAKRFLDLRNNLLKSSK